MQITIQCAGIRDYGLIVVPVTSSPLSLPLVLRRLCVHSEGECKGLAGIGLLEVETRGVPRSVQHTSERRHVQARGMWGEWTDAANHSVNMFG